MMTARSISAVEIGARTADESRIALAELLQAVAIAANEADRPETALQTALDRICAYAGWPVGHALLVADDGSGTLQSAGLWVIEEPAERYASLRRLRESPRSPSGVGLREHVLAEKKPAWILDTAEDTTPPPEIARDAGIRAALAFPIFVGTDVVGVLEFFSSSADEPDDAFLAAMSTVGAQLGRVIQRVCSMRALVRTAENLQVLANNVDSALWVFDLRSGTTSYISPGHTRYTGRHLVTNQIGQSGFEFVYEPDRAVLIEAMTQVAAGKAGEVECRIALPSGELRWCSVRAVPVRDGEGNVIAIAGVSTDVQDRKAMEDELRKARDAAEGADRVKSAFFANVSHELRTPMNAIMGMASLLLDSGLSSQQQDQTETIRSGADSLLSTINDILDFSKIEAGDIDLEEQPFDLRECAESAIELFEAQAEEKRLRLSLATHAGVPSVVIGDVTRLRQVLAILLSNAVKFTEAGEVAVSIEPASSESSPDELHFSVRDTGVGFSPEHQEVLFQAFRQADDSRTRRFGGIGLGLSIGRRLVELMAGRMWAESEGVPGKGSTFHFALALAPVAAGESPAAPRESHAATAADATLAGRVPLHILLAEDNVVNQKVALLMLRRFGYRADLASNGREAIAAVLRQPYDVVLMDVQMPEVDGLAAARRIRDEVAAELQPRIIALTADTDRSSCLSAGMDDYVQKPLNMEKLRVALERCADPVSRPRATQIDALPEAIERKALESLKRLRGEGGGEVVAELVADLARKGPALIAEMRRAVETENPTGLRVALIRLRGVTHPLGAIQLERLGADLDWLARSGSLAAALPLLALFETELERALRTLDEEAGEA
jgi:PAS domain S-box-containing protein